MLFIFVFDDFSLYLTGIYTPNDPGARLFSFDRRRRIKRGTASVEPKRGTEMAALRARVDAPTPLTRTSAYVGYAASVSYVPTSRATHFGAVCSRLSVVKLCRARVSAVPSPTRHGHAGTYLRRCIVRIARLDRRTHKSRVSSRYSWPTRIVRFTAAKRRLDDYRTVIRDFGFSGFFNGNRPSTTDRAFR